MKPTEQIEYFAGITNPGENDSANKAIRLLYFWEGPANGPYRQLSVSFDASKRHDPEGNYRASVIVRFDVNSIISTAGEFARIAILMLLKTLIHLQ